MDSCAQATSTALAANDAGGTAVPTFAGTHAANASVVGAATDAITAFFNSEQTPEAAATALAGLDPRESVTVEFVFQGAGGDLVKTAYVEVGDFAAGRAFLAASATR